MAVDLSPGAAAMLDEIERKSFGVSFVELERAYERVHGKGSAQGDIACVSDRNIVLWSAMSQGFYDALAELHGKVLHRPCEWLIYMIDGKALGFPMVNRPPRSGYKEPHWLPTAFSSMTDTREPGWWLWSDHPFATVVNEPKPKRRAA